MELHLIKANPGIKAFQLAQETGVSERTIYRDLRLISDCQIPIHFDNGYKLSNNDLHFTSSLSAKEYGLLSLALSWVALQRPDFQKLAQNLLSKIESRLEPHTRKVVNTFCETYKIYSRPVPQPLKISLLSPIIEQAIQKECKLRIIYHSLRDGLKESTLQPYYLVFRNQGWHLLGFCEQAKDFQIFNLSFVKSITLLDQNFKKDPNFSLEKFFENKWEIQGGKLYTVKIKFKGAAAKLILSSQRHPKEEISKLRDGSVIYTVTIEGLEEITRWILTFGEEAEVLKPKELKEKIGSIAKNLAKLYLQKGSHS